MTAPVPDQRDTRTLLGEFLDTLPIGTFVIDAGAHVTFANVTALTMLGRDALPEGDGRDGLALWPAGGAAPVSREQHPLTQALRGLAARADGYEIRTGTRVLPVEVVASPIFDSAGRVAYAIAAMSDITERKRSQAALRAAKEAAEQANQAKSDFLARMSHELRTPLNSIIGFANILVKKPPAQLAPGERTYLERIQENGRQLLLLINDILDLARIEAGRLVLEREPVDLGALISNVLAQWDVAALKGGAVQLETVLPPALAPLHTDSVRLRQVLVNLVGNAIKFTERGTVRVLVETAAGTDRAACIRVIDTGIGIAPDRLDAIFGAFEQAEAGTTRRYGGTGLGLAISRALCDLMGYALTARSHPGEGSEFTVRIEPSGRA